MTHKESIFNYWRGSSPIRQVERGCAEMWAVFENWAAWFYDTEEPVSETGIMENKERRHQISSFNSNI